MLLVILLCSGRMCSVGSGAGFGALARIMWVVFYWIGTTWQITYGGGVALRRLTTLSLGLVSICSLSAVIFPLCTSLFSSSFNYFLSLFPLSSE